VQLWQRIGGVVAVGLVGLVGVVGGLVAWGGPLNDLRPDVITVDAPQPDREAKGRELLQAAYEAHGAKRWMDQPGQRLQLRDDWPGTMGVISRPWPLDGQRLTVHQRRHNSFDSEVVMHGEGVEGTVWAIQDGQPYKQLPGQPRAAVDDDAIAFLLPTMHYFVELPQRITEAELVRYVGTETVGDTTYEVVYATWGSWAAGDTYDQYLVYIDPQTGRIDKAAYTVRDITRFLGGAAHYDGFDEVGGVLMPGTITITFDVNDDPTDDANVIHRMTIESLEIAAL